MNKIKIDKQYIEDFISDKELEVLLGRIKGVHDGLNNKNCLGNDYIGWLDLPVNVDKKELSDIEDTASKIRKKATSFILVGIGGSYLGARSGIEFVKPLLRKDEKVKFYYAGHNLCGDYLKELLNEIKDEDVVVNVVSKSGTTTEPAIAFRIIEEFLKKRYSQKELKDRIICTTDKNRGSLLDIAKSSGYKTFVIPDDVGGRYSVLTPVGLLPLAVGGLDIRQLLKGAEISYERCNKLNYEENPSYLYAGIRYLLSLKGKDIEILSNFHPSFHYVAEWWKQLFGESEGKNKLGIYPASCDFTTDLHSMGQYIQEGKRHIFETFLVLDSQISDVKIPKSKPNLDGLNYLSGKSVEYVNHTAFLATRSAHKDGGVPNISIFVPDRSENSLGQLFYFFEKAVAISGLLTGVNPFNQPGVEAYKKNMFKLLGKAK